MKHIVYDVVAYEFLEGKYDYILKSMLDDEFYILQDKIYDFFYEITYYGRVVGFICGDFHKDIGCVCDLCYILPKYRSIGLFVSAINTINNLFDIGVCLNLPNSFAVDSLIHNNRAIKLNNHLVVSEFPLTFTPKDSDSKVHSRLYDMNACGIVILQEKLISPLLDVDARYRNPVRNINKDYFKKIENELLRSI